MIQRFAQARELQMEIVKLRRSIARSLLRHRGIPTSKRLIAKVSADRSIDQIYEICELRHKRSIKYKYRVFSAAMRSRFARVFGRK